MFQSRLRTVLVLTVAVLLFFPAQAFSADEIPIKALTRAFEDFADGLARSLPLNSAIGLNWSDAYIGQLVRVPPNLGIGVTTGVTTIPKSVMEDALKPLGADDVLDSIPDIGLPFPGYTLDLRLGGVVWPFDVGFKVGTLQGVEALLPNDFDIEYLLIGADIRVPVIRENLVLPMVSVGLGFNYLQGRLGIDGVYGDDVTITKVEVGPAEYTVVLEDPDLFFEWSSRVIDLKVQASKNFLILTPHIGMGLSYAMSNAGGGIDSKVEVRDDLGNPVANQNEIIRAINKGFGTDFQRNQGIEVFEDVNSFALRVFGGTSLNLFVLRLDFGVMYDFIGQNIGGTIGARIQL